MDIEPVSSAPEVILMVPVLNIAVNAAFCPLVTSIELVPINIIFSASIFAEITEVNVSVDVICSPLMKQ